VTTGWIPPGCCTGSRNVLVLCCRRQPLKNLMQHSRKMFYCTGHSAMQSSNNANLPLKPIVGGCAWSQSARGPAGASFTAGLELAICPLFTRGLPLGGGGWDFLPFYLQGRGEQAYLLDQAGVPAPARATGSRDGWQSYLRGGSPSGGGTAATGHRFHGLAGCRWRCSW